MADFIQECRVIAGINPLTKAWSDFNHNKYKFLFFVPYDVASHNCLEEDGFC